MKFYRVYSNDDPAQSDAIFPTKKAREQHIAEMYEADDEDVIRSEIEVKGPLTKETVCKVYALAMR